MTSLESLIRRTRDGDDDAYGRIVRRFQDMAVGYGYSILRDFQLAEDAAQDAFFEAYRNLDKLREPVAFPGWFRKIVFKQCDRITRNKAFSLITMDELEDRVSQEASQAIKKRLYSARNRLREMLVDLVEDSLRELRPSRDELFASTALELLKSARAGDAAKVKRLLEQDPRLIAARDPLGNTALILATNSGHDEIAEMLIGAGVSPDFYEAASIGRTDLVAQFLNGDASLLDSQSPEGFTALALAAHFGQINTLEFLVARGADLNIVSQHAMGVTPLHAALFGRRVEAARILIESGADVTPKRGGTGWPRAGWTAFHYLREFRFR